MPALACPAKFASLDVGFCLIPTVFLSVAISIAGEGIQWRGMLVLFVICLASLNLGRAVCKLKISAFRTCGEFLGGALMASLIIFGLCRIFVISSGRAACLAVIMAILATIFAHGKTAKARTTLSDLVLMFLVCSAALIWSWQAIQAVPHLFASGHFDAWTDYFIHAGEISQFANFGPLHGATIFAGGAPLPPYHYGSYMFAATLAGLTGILSLAAATGFWTPFGFILLGLGAGVLGGVLADEAGGFIAVAILLLVPSASHYGLADPFFDVHWLLQISSGSSYGIACAILSIVALVIWLRGREPSALAWVIVFTFATFEFHVQIFTPLVMANAVICLVAWHPAGFWSRPILIVLGAMVIVGLMMSMETVQRAPHFFTGAHHPIRPLLFMLGMKPSQSEALYQGLANTLPNGIGLPNSVDRAVILAIGILLLFVAEFGVLLPLYIGGLFWRRLAGQRHVEDFIPLSALLSYLAVFLTFPTDAEEHLEFAHRPFVLSYTFLAIWCARFIVDLMHPGFWRQPAAALLAFGLLITPLRLQSKAQLSALEWGFQYCDVPIPSGLIAAASYVRAHADPDAIVAYPPNPQDDAFLALSQRPAYFPGTEFLAIQSGLDPANLAKRGNSLVKMLASRDMATYGVNWVVTFPPTTPPPNAAFDASYYSVLHLKPKS